MACRATFGSYERGASKRFHALCVGRVNTHSAKVTSAQYKASSNDMMPMNWTRHDTLIGDAFHTGRQDGFPNVRLTRRVPASEPADVPACRMAAQRTLRRAMACRATFGSYESGASKHFHALCVGRVNAHSAKVTSAQHKVGSNDMMSTKQQQKQQGQD